MVDNTTSKLNRTENGRNIISDGKKTENETKICSSPILICENIFSFLNFDS